MATLQFRHHYQSCPLHLNIRIVSAFPDVTMSGGEVVHLDRARARWPSRWRWGWPWAGCGPRRGSGRGARPGRASWRRSCARWSPSCARPRARRGPRRPRAEELRRSLGVVEDRAHRLEQELATPRRRGRWPKPRPASCAAISTSKGVARQRRGEAGRHLPRPGSAGAGRQQRRLSDLGGREADRGPQRNRRQRWPRGRPPSTACSSRSRNPSTRWTPRSKSSSASAGRPTAS
jgi:hypothetical protein